MRVWSKWGWLVYPVMVGLFVVVSANLMVNNRDTWFQAAVGTSEKEELESQMAELRGKLVLLESVDVEREKEDLELMAKAVLPNRAIWLTVLEIKDAASQAGVLINSYSAVAVGDVKEVESSGSAQITDEVVAPMRLEVAVESPDLAALRKMIGVLETRMPLVQVAKISFQQNAVEMVVEGAWKPWAGGGEVNLEGYRSQVAGGEAEKAGMGRY